MNCFQNFIYIWPDTTIRRQIHYPHWLWIAFKILFTFDLIQLLAGRIGYLLCCELLSKFYLHLTWYNNCPVNTGMSCVVNCFQNFIYIWPDTTSLIVFIVVQRLWIAFKILFTFDLIQPLVSFPNVMNVVNCFQNFIYIWPDTTVLPSTSKPSLLWIAFKILFTFDLIQLGWRTYFPSKCCELLSKFYLHLTWYNIMPQTSDTVQLWIAFKILFTFDLIQLYVMSQINRIVVNCFQNFIYIWPDTT